MLPGAGKLKGLKNLKPDDKELKRIEAIINSMTPGERRDHKVINASRKKRIARGSGVAVADVNRLLKNFLQARKMMKSMTRMGGGKGLGRFLPI
jgi:signal recognition particle subunit SRP54